MKQIQLNHAEEYTFKLQWHLEYTRREEVVDYCINKYGIKKVYDNIDDVYKDKDVDIIYISTPHNTHISFLKKVGIISFYSWYWKDM